MAEPRTFLKEKKMKNNFAAQFKEYRKRLDISQEEIAERLNVTSQAVSKWECEKSFPDIQMLIDIAELFDISLDALIVGDSGRAVVAGLPDDEELRVVFCRGRQVVDSKDADNAIRIKLESKVEKLEVWGSAKISGDIYGNVTAGGGINCDKVEGSVSAGASVNCDEVTGNIKAGAGVNCDSVGGDVVAGTNIVCDDIGGNVNCGLTLQCDNISGKVSCGMTITCDNISGNIEECKGDIHIKTLNGTVQNCDKTVYIKDEN